MNGKRRLIKVTFYFWAASDNVTVTSDGSILRSSNQLVHIVENDLEIISKEELQE